MNIGIVFQELGVGRIAEQLEDQKSGMVHPIYQEACLKLHFPFFGVPSVTLTTIGNSSFSSFVFFHVDQAI